MIADENQRDESTLRDVLLPDDDTPEFEEVTFSSELKELSTLSFPVALSTLARLVIINTDTGFVGHLPNSKSMLSAAQFANTWNQFLSNIVFAPGYALNSLCSQAIGAGNKKLAGVWLQMAIFMTSIVCIPVLVGYLLTEQVVGLMVPAENADIADLAGQFNTVAILILWPMVMYMIIRQYFQAVQIVKPAMIVSGLTVGFNFGANWLFVPEGSVFHWGLKGSPFATFLSMLFQLGTFLLYTVVYKGYHKPYWGGWSWEFLEKSRIARFMKMVFPMAIGIVLENSGLQLISFSTGHIGETRMAAHSILSALWGVLWAFYWGYGLALQVRVGHYLGQGNVQGARMVAKISMTMVFFICALVGFLTWVFRNPIAQIFTKDPEIIAIVEESMYALVLDYFFACMALCAVNLLEAMAQNRILAFTLSFGMWVVQVPCSLLFCYKIPYFKETRQVEGIWMGQVCGELFKMFVLWAFISKLDWKKMCREAKERSEVSDEDNEEQLLGEDSIESLSQDTAEGMASALYANSPSPFIGSRSPKNVRSIN